MVVGRGEQTDSHKAREPKMDKTYKIVIQHRATQRRTRDGVPALETFSTIMPASSLAAARRMASEFARNFAWEWEGKSYTGRVAVVENA